ncbi:MAG: GNAT family N-acetyltransferase [Spirochaetales bacterium]|jgi:spermidine synthase|nr:GNAT family N-acetyltransferase [Exilispira sp.]NMC67876.1 GNAT family N-acetyltransferase [Spirochaetales bacterium]
MREQIKIKIIKKIKSEEVISLYKEAGWWNDEDEKDPNRVKKIIKNSLIFIGAFYNKQLVGIGRAISDKVSDAYIQDVVVSKNFRKKGIGKKLVLYILNYLKIKKINWIALISTPDSSEFYKKIGFENMEGFIPMIFKGNLLKEENDN